MNGLNVERFGLESTGTSLKYLASLCSYIKVIASSSRSQEQNSTSLYPVPGWSASAFHWNAILYRLVFCFFYWKLLYSGVGMTNNIVCGKYPLVCRIINFYAISRCRFCVPLQPARNTGAGIWLRIKGANFWSRFVMDIIRKVIIILKKEGCAWVTITYSPRLSYWNSTR